jgi:hypothetical protein
VTRYDHGAVLLDDGRVVIAAGFSGSGGSRQAGQTIEIIDLTAEADGAVAIKDPNLPDGFTDEDYTALLTGVGGSDPYQFEVVEPTALPPGLNLSGATISGIPTTPGTYYFGVRITDDADPARSATQTLRIRINALEIATTPLPTAFVGQAYPAVLETSDDAGGLPPVTWSLFSGSVPTGLTLQTDGTFSNAPGTTGTFNFTVKAVDSADQVAIAQLSIQVVQPLTINTVSLSDATAGQGYNYGLSWSGGSGPVTWSFAPDSDTPAGLSLQANGNLTATRIDEAGTFALKVVAESSGQTVQRTLSLRVGVNGAGSCCADNTTTQSVVTFSGSQAIAQTIRHEVAGSLLGIDLPVFCSAGDLIVEIRNLRADVSNAPGSQVLSSTTIAGGMVPPYGSGEPAFYRRLTLPAPVALPIDARFAVVLRAANGGTCGVVPIQSVPDGWNHYPHGDAFVGDGTSFTRLAETDPNRPDLPFNTLIDPGRNALSITAAWRSSGFTATRLGNEQGDVLVTGGSASPSAEIYSRATRRFTATTGSMMVPRAWHTATKLSDGRVLITGGHDLDNFPNPNVLSLVEVFDPQTGEFETVGNLAVPRFQHVATLLGGSRVLITGGYSSFNQGPIASAEVFTLNGTAGSSGGLITMTSSRAQHTATVFNDGTALVTGGWGGNGSAEIFTPIGLDSGSFAATTGAMVVPRASHTATLFASGPLQGQVLIVGGQNQTDAAYAELYDPATGSFASPPGDASLQHPRAGHTATLLGNGKIAIIGGYGPFDGPWTPALAQVEIAEVVITEDGPQVQIQVQIRGGGTTRIARSQHQATLLADGSVLVSGGHGRAGAVGSTAELYVPSALGGLALKTTNLPDGSVDDNYSAQLAAEGTSPPFTFSIPSGLPSNLELIGDTITGVPDTAGTAHFVVTVTDAAQRSVSQALSIAIDRFSVDTDSLPNAFFEQAYEEQLEAANASGTVTWSIQFGQLPPGLSLDSNGQISGQPTSHGGWGFTVKAVDDAGRTAFKDLNISVNTPLQITTTSLPMRYAGEFGLPWISFNGGSGQRAFSVVDPAFLPRGVTLNSDGSFQGSPLQTGDFTFTVKVTDCQNESCGINTNQQTDTQELSWRIAAVDQQSWGDGSGGSVAIGDDARVAFTVTAGSTGWLAGIRLPGLVCTANSPLTAGLYPLTVGEPQVPNDAAPWQTVTVAAPNSFDAIPFETTVAGGAFFPMGARFAVVLSTTGSCTLQQAATYDTYAGGQAFVSTSAAGGWSPAPTPDVPFNTLILPTAELTWTGQHHNGHQSTDLGDGLILFTGSGAPQIYDPSEVPPLSMTGPMIQQRWQSTATRLASGKVLIAGGQGFVDNMWVNLDTAEIFDPETGMFTEVPGVMQHGRWQHTATLLDSGVVLIAGGSNNTGILQSAEIFDPAMNSGAGGFRVLNAPGGLRQGRSQHTATVITVGEHAGKVLLAGGWQGPFTELVSLELFDPGSETFAAMGTGEGYVEMRIPRARHTATVLPDGRILFAGGQWTYGVGLATHAEIFTPAPVGEFFNPPNELTGAHLTPRVEHTATLLADGSVLLTGGFDHTQWNNQPTATTERWRPLDGTFEGRGRLAVGRADHTADLLADGTILINGGWGSGLSSQTIEIFDVANTIGVAAFVMPQAGVAQPYSAALIGTGGTGPYAFQVASGTLPDGLTLDLNGLLQGQATTPGTYSVVVQIFAGGLVGYHTITIEVVNTLAVSRTIVHGIVGEPLDFPVESAGGYGATQWVVDGDFGLPPDGVAFSAEGVLNGVPAQAGHFSFGARATDSHPTIPQTAAERIRVAIADRDQFQGDRSASVIAGGTPVSTVWGQVVTAGVPGTLSAIRLPIACSTGGFGSELYVEIRDVFNGKPGNAVHTFAYFADGVAAFPSPMSDRIIQFPTPLFVRAGDQFSIFIFNYGQCEIGAGAAGQTYGGGDLFSAPSEYFNVPWQAADRDLAFETLVEPVLFANFGSSVTDGEIAPAEWTAAGQMHFMVNLPGGGSTPGTLMIMNDATDVHLAVVYERDVRDALAYINVNADNNNDGAAYQGGDDLWSLSGDGRSGSGFGDSVGVSAGCPAPPQACQYPPDSQQGGATHGQGAVWRNGSVFAFEVTHPFNSGDPNDIALLVGQQFGVHINMSVQGVENTPSSYGFAQVPSGNFQKAVPVTIVPQ